MSEVGASKNPQAVHGSVESLLVLESGQARTTAIVRFAVAVHLNVVHCAYDLPMAKQTTSIRAICAVFGVVTVAAVAGVPPTNAAFKNAPKAAVATPRTQAISVFDDPAARAANETKSIVVTIDGPEASANTERGAPFYFSAVAGQSIIIGANRDWSLWGPIGEGIDSGPANDSGVITLTDSGRYLLLLEPGVFAPATVKVATGAPTSITISSSVGQVLTFDNNQVQFQMATVAVTGGQRYRLVVLPSEDEATHSICADDESYGRIRSSLACVSQSRYTENSASFVTDRDLVVTLKPNVSGRFTGSLRARIELAPNDILADTTTNAVVDTEAQPGQSIVIPFWGTPAGRAMISSPDVNNVAPWGEPWIDRERTGSPSAADSPTQKVFAVPVVFDPTKTPFLSWTGRALASGETGEVNKRRFGVYRGEDAAAKIPTTGEPIVLKNKPWFASVGSLEFGEGERYALQVTGTKIRPVSLALRDPSGKFSSNLSPWQWTEDNGIQRAVTQVTSNRPGRWALELRPAGNSVSDITVSVAKLGSGGSYKGVIVVDEPLAIGESTDVNLSPNEFAQFTVKLNSATPQIIQPEVLRYRNKTFQRTAVDMSVWDAQGRLVWSNNRNLEEEVLSGNNGRELLLADKQAVVSSAEPYRVVIDPHSDLAGRFRVSVSSTPVLSDVSMGNGPIPIIPGGTKTAVVQVDKPTRYRISGLDACIAVTSLTEWSRGLNPGSAPVPAIAPASVSAASSAAATTTLPNQRTIAPTSNQRCVRNGRTISLPIGVHRFSFSEKVEATDTFTQVASGSPADPVVNIDAVIEGPAVTVPNGQDPTALVFSATAGTRMYAERSSGAAGGSLQWPDGTLNRVGGVFVTPVTGTYILWVSTELTSYSLRLRKAPAEVQLAKATLGAKSQAVNLVYGQRLEVAFSLAKPTVVALETLSGSGAQLQFEYAADGFERRYLGGGGDGKFEYLALPSGTFRLVFTGDGLSRIRVATTKQSKLQPVIIEGQ